MPAYRYRVHKRYGHPGGTERVVKKVSVDFIYIYVLVDFTEHTVQARVLSSSRHSSWFRGTI